MMMVCIDTVDKKNVFKNWMDDSGIVEAWLGLHSPNNQGWEWVDGCDSTYNSWMAGEPQDHYYSSFGTGVMVAEGEYKGEGIEDYANFYSCDEQCGDYGTRPKCVCEPGTVDLSACSDDENGIHCPPDGCTCTTGYRNDGNDMPDKCAMSPDTGLQFASSRWMPGGHLSCRVPPW